jgi:hypothetical protein
MKPKTYPGLLTDCAAVTYGDPHHMDIMRTFEVSLPAALLHTVKRIASLQNRDLDTCIATMLQQGVDAYGFTGDIEEAQAILDGAGEGTSHDANELTRASGKIVRHCELIPGREYRFLRLGHPHDGKNVKLESVTNDTVAHILAHVPDHMQPLAVDVCELFPKDTPIPVGAFK